MRNEWLHIPLADFAAVRAQGPDAVRFLQGQLSNDVSKLSAERSLLAGLHNAQGRTIAVLRLVQAGTDEILMLVPRELASGVTARLSKFVLRAKVKIQEPPQDGLRISGLVAPDGVATLPSTATALSTQAPDSTAIVQVDTDPLRWLVISPAGTDANRIAQQTGAVTGDREIWRRFDIKAGLAQVYVTTSEEFVAQMLNLDMLHAISFEKGCYTGQEVIARAHYRGRVKRRMQRFASREAISLHSGDSGQLSDGRTFKVVEAVERDDGRCEFLAVAPLLSAAPEPGESQSAAPVAAISANLLIEADQLPLPYPLPD